MRKLVNLTRRPLALVLTAITLAAILNRSARGQDVSKINKADEVQQIASAPIGGRRDYEEPPLFEKRGGILEAVPGKYRKRSEAWKKEFRSTETGRRDWEAYEQNARFTLVIAVSCAKRHGASVDNSSWDDSGRLIATTITLGCRLDEGYPAPIYYPVINSLAAFRLRPLQNRANILAAMKMAHEFGHVKRLANIDGAQRQLQERIAPLYTRILLTNGYSIDDPRLIELGQMMGGTPMQIFEDDEYFAESHAMEYVREKFAKGLLPCSVLLKIEENIASYAKAYEESFVQIGASESTLDLCRSKRISQSSAQR